MWPQQAGLLPSVSVRSYAPRGHAPLRSPDRRRKSPRVKRQFDRMLELDKTNEKQVKRLLPYGG